MNNKIKVLDHGFVKLLNISGPVRRTHREEEEVVIEGNRYVPVYKLLPFDGDDIDPAIAARISFNNLEEERTREQDLRLVEYLMKNVHTTPSEMPSIWFHMKLPIFVARQSERHRTAKIFEGIEEYCDPSINEVSGRYVTLPEEWYIPEVVGGKSTNGAKQGQEDNLSIDLQEHFKRALDSDCSCGYEQYLDFLALGVAPEHARMFLHVNHYTHWLWKQDLHNLMHFLSLRLHDHAQVEARAYANAIYELLKQHLPETMKLFDKYRRLLPDKITIVNKTEL